MIRLVAALVALGSACGPATKANADHLGQLKAEIRALEGEVRALSEPRTICACASAEPRVLLARASLSSR